MVQTTKLTAEVCRKRGNPTLSKPMLELEQLFLDVVNHWGRGQNNGGARLSAMGCSVLGRGAEPLVRTQFLEHPPTLNFGANHLKK